MTLQESIQRLLEISNQKKELTKKIKENYLHSEENDLLYERWLSTRFECVRQKIRKEIANGEKKLEEYLELLESAKSRAEKEYYTQIYNFLLAQRQKEVIDNESY